MTPLPSRRELVVYRAVLSLTSHQVPEISLAELALRLRLGHPSRELWRRLERLELKNYLAISVNQKILTRASRIAEHSDLPGVPTHIRLRPLVPRDETLARYFSGLFTDHLGLDDDTAFLAALASWVDNELARSAREETAPSAVGGS